MISERELYTEKGYIQKDILAIKKIMQQMYKEGGGYTEKKNLEREGGYTRRKGRETN